MKKTGILRIVCLFILLSLLTYGKENLVLIPFKNNTGIKGNYESKLTSLIEVELINRKEYNIIDRSNLEKIINEQKLTLMGVVSSENAAKVGKIAGAKIAVVGNLYTLNSHYQNGTWKSELMADVKIINSETASVYQSMVLRGEARSRNKKTSINLALEELAKKFREENYKKDIENEIKDFDFNVIKVKNHLESEIKFDLKLIRKWKNDIIIEWSIEGEEKEPKKVKKIEKKEDKKQKKGKKNDNFFNDGFSKEGFDDFSFDEFEKNNSSKTKKKKEKPKKLKVKKSLNLKNGKIKRQAEDKEIVLIATFIKSNVKINKKFNLVIKSLEDSISLWNIKSGTLDLKNKLYIAKTSAEDAEYEYKKDIDGNFELEMELKKVGQSFGMPTAVEIRTVKATLGIIPETNTYYLEESENNKISNKLSYDIKSKTFNSIKIVYEDEYLKLYINNKFLNKLEINNTEEASRLSIYFKGSSYVEQGIEFKNFKFKKID